MKSLSIVLAVVVPFSMVAAVARADGWDHDGRRGEWREHSHGYGWRGPVVMGGPIYVEPPPVYYAPPPAVVYAPPPVVYAPPVMVAPSISLGINLPLR